MADWSTAAQLATALGTLVLATATFVAVRAATERPAWPSTRCRSASGRS
jgi:hypothetical protein